MPTLPSACRRRLVCCLFTIAVLFPGDRTAGDDAGTFADGVLVLLNGNVIEGRFQRSGDWYLVRQGSADYKVATKQVEMFCGSLDEAYELRRRHTMGNSANVHADLATWCLRNGLLDQAGREIDAMEVQDQKHPLLRRLAAQHAQAIDQQHRSRRPENQQAAAPVYAAPAVASAPAARDATADLPPSSRSEFVRSIHPMLVHNCAASGCHQTNSSHSFQMDRLAMTGRGHPALLARNMASTLDHVDRTNPTESLLVDYANRVHGTPSHLSTPLRPHQAALLVDWLVRAYGPLEMTQPLADASDAGAGPTAETTALDSGFERGALAGEEESMVDEQPLQQPKGLTHQPFRVGVELKTFVPRDAFDPEIFHRRHHAAQHSPPTSTTSSAVASERTAAGGD